MVCKHHKMFYTGESGKPFVEKFVENLPKNKLNTIKSIYANTLMYNHKHTEFQSTINHCIFIKCERKLTQLKNLRYTRPTPNNVVRSAGFYTNDNTA